MNNAQMNDPSQIDYVKDLEARLQGRPGSQHAILAERVALRVLPLWTRCIHEDWARELNLTSAPILRLNLATGVARVFPTRQSLVSLEFARSAFASLCAGAALDRRGNIEPATLAACAAAALATDAAGPAGTLSAFTVASRVLDQPLFAAIKDDIVQLDTGGDVADQPLWRGPNPLIDEWEASLSILRDAPGGDFWIDWYQRALDGLPQNWPLLHDVALIDFAFWERGGKALDDAINNAVGRPAPQESDDQDSRDSLEDGVRRVLPSATVPNSEVAERVRAAISLNRAVLPPTFDAIEGLLLLEMTDFSSRTAVIRIGADNCISTSHSTKPSARCAKPSRSTGLRMTAR